MTVFILDYDVAQINTNTDIDATLIRISSIASKHRTLQLNCAMYRIHNTAKLCEEAIPINLNMRP